MALRADVRVARDSFEVHVAFEAADGETIAILGPNGAGKSTILEALAGVILGTDATIELDGERIDRLPPERRRVGLCFQDDLLFPTMSAVENVAFGPRSRGTPKGEAKRTAIELLRDLAPEVPPDARPRTLSGGQRRRVALARALATEPRLLLLDEPLAGVDISARAQIRDLLRRVTDAFDGVVLLVAHEPLDALTLADRVVIIERGRVSQAGTPDEIRSSPGSSYAADLVGVNLFEGTLTALDDGAATLATSEGSIVVAPVERVAGPVGALATLRPLDVALYRERPDGSPRNLFRGSITEVIVDGDRARIRLATSPPLTAEVTAGSAVRLGLATGAEVWASFKAVEVSLQVEGGGDSTSAAGTLGG